MQRSGKQSPSLHSSHSLENTHWLKWNSHRPQWVEMEYDIDCNERLWSLS